MKIPGSFVVVVIMVVVSGTGEISLISHTFHPVDFSPGFASSISLQFSVEQPHVALQSRASLSANRNPSSNLIFERTLTFRSFSIHQNHNNQIPFANDNEVQVGNG